MMDTKMQETILLLSTNRDYDSGSGPSGDTAKMKVPNHPHIWRPPTDLYETEQAYIVRIEVAGMNKEEFCINLDDNRLDISGIRPDMPLNRAYHQLEIPFGSFRSIVKLPAPINSSQVSAEYHDGFLIISLPKIIPVIIKIQEE